MSLFYRAWEKYRFYIPYEREGLDRIETDPFTNCLYSLIGLEAKPLRKPASCQHAGDHRRGSPGTGAGPGRGSGTCSDSAACSVTGRDAPCRSRRCSPIISSSKPRSGNSRGNGSSSGRRTDRVSKASTETTNWASRLCWVIVSGMRRASSGSGSGPSVMTSSSTSCPTDRRCAERKAIFLLVHLVRLYVEPTLDFDIQLILACERGTRVPVDRNGRLRCAAGLEHLDAHRYLSPTMRTTPYSKARKSSVWTRSERSESRTALKDIAEAGSTFGLRAFTIIDLLPIAIIDGSRGLHAAHIADVALRGTWTKPLSDEPESRR